jgi:hypothetical protein
MIRLVLSGGLLLALTLAGLSLHVPGTGALGSTQDNLWFVVLAGAGGAVYLLTVLGMPRRPALRGAVWVVLGIAAALRLPLLPVAPFLSSDVNRYVWDGMVQAAGINPYRYIPADPALVSLRDQAVYPHINRGDYAPTIYPPAAQAIFALTGLIWPSVTAMKTVMVGFEAVAIACLLRLLADAGLPPERVLIYAWNPLPVWAFAGNGHIDAAAVGFVALALLLRVRRRDGWAGVALGAAVATKFLPAVIGPALWRRGGGWKCLISGLAIVAVLYAAYSSAGSRIFGFLSGYGAEEGLDDGSGFWLLAGLSRIGTLPRVAAPLYLAVALIALAALAAWIAFVRRPDGAVAVCSAAGLLMAAVTFAISPHYPWYFTWLAVPAALAPSPALLWLSVSPLVLYLGAAAGDRFAWPSVIFVPALLLAFTAYPIKETARC